MDDNGRVESLVLLVGSNPLPNYLAAMALKPSKLSLVYSRETEKPRDRLREALIADLRPAPNIDGDVFIEDAFSASTVCDKIASLMNDSGRVHLHYTGGTKVMSAHALKAFYNRGGNNKNASYLDEINARLRRDDGTSTSLSDYRVTLNMERILQLHGVTHKERSPVEGGPTAVDVQRIATAIQQRPQLASCLYGERKRLEEGTFKEAKESPCCTEEYGVALSAPKIPGRDMTKKVFEAWYEFISGEWLEQWVRTRIEEIGFSDGPKITVGVNCSRVDVLTGTSRPFEVDVAAVRGQRPYFISCTTDMTRSLCKSKAFEISVRARQMGGDLARSAVVCLLSGGLVEDLQADVNDAWSSTNAPRIFGLEDLRTWAGHYGTPNLDSFKEWLES